MLTMTDDSISARSKKRQQCIDNHEAVNMKGHNRLEERNIAYSPRNYRKP
jgi:hypothetical protein